MHVEPHLQQTSLENGTSTSKAYHEARCRNILVKFAYILQISNIVVKLLKYNRTRHLIRDAMLNATKPP